MNFRFDCGLIGVVWLIRVAEQIRLGRAVTQTVVAVAGTQMVVAVVAVVTRMAGVAGNPVRATVCPQSFPGSRVRALCLELSC